MAVTSSITQAISFSESGGSGIATSNRTTAVAPQVTMTTSATGVNMVWSTTFNLTGPVLLDLDLYDTNAGGGDDDDRGSIRFANIHGIVVNLTSGECAVGDQAATNPWTSAPQGATGAFDLVGPASLTLLNAQSFGPVSATNRTVRISCPSTKTAVGSITFIGEGTIL